MILIKTIRIDMPDNCNPFYLICCRSNITKTMQIHTGYQVSSQFFHRHPWDIKQVSRAILFLPHIFFPAKLADHLANDAFWASDFFALVHSIQEATKDGELEDPTLLYGLLDAVIETEDRPAVIKVVGRDTKSVFTFLTEVISSNDVASDAGDSLGE